jgi:hypothetical protein
LPPCASGAPREQSRPAKRSTGPECLKRYWALAPAVEKVALRIEEPRVEMALLKRLGAPEFEGLDARSFWAQMEGVYGAVTRRALGVAFADAG